MSAHIRDAVNMQLLATWLTVSIQNPGEYGTQETEQRSALCAKKTAQLNVTNERSFTTFYSRQCSRQMASTLMLDADIESWK